MPPSIFFIVTLTDFLITFEQFLSVDDESLHTLVDSIVLMRFIQIIPLLLEIISLAIDAIKDTSRENDAHKLIRYCREYR